MAEAGAHMERLGESVYGDELSERCKITAVDRAIAADAGDTLLARYSVEASLKIMAEVLFRRFWMASGRRIFPEYCRRWGLR
jgi:hypothetical protein